MFCQIKHIPSRELTYPTLGKGKSSSKCHFWWDMLVPRRVIPPVLVAEVHLGPNNPSPLKNYLFDLDFVDQTRRGSKIKALNLHKNKGPPTVSSCWFQPI